MSKDPRRNELGERLAPGFWVDKAGALHVSIPELLEVFRLEDTPKNREFTTHLVRELMQEQCPQATITERETPDD